MNNSTTADDALDKAERQLLERYKAAATEKHSAMEEAMVQFHGFAKVYEQRQRRYLANRFMEKFGDKDGWLQIKSDKNPELNGCYEYKADDLVGKPYVYMESAKSLDLWIQLRPLGLVGGGFRASYIPTSFVSGDFLHGSCAVPCDKPEFKKRPQKKQETK